MTQRRSPLYDSAPALLARGYAWLPGLRRRAGGDVTTRLLGKRAVGLRGPEAVRFFYDERHVTRAGVVPEPIKGTLFGKGGVHGLDGQAHRTRKAMFLTVLADPDSVARLVGRVGEAWEARAATWPGRERVVLFDEAAAVIAEGVCAWAGVPVDDPEGIAADMVAMVDGFATLGPRHWRARRARGRREPWLAGLFEAARAGEVVLPAGSPADIVARHRDDDGQPLPPRVAAVELINMIRPTVAVAWFVAFAGHALHRWPHVRQALRDGDPAHAEAFAQEVRRFYPFAPFVGGRAAADLTWRGERIPEGALVLLDLYGQHHDDRLWQDPYSFDPGRFLGTGVGRDDLVPQGGGDPHTGHRCPGEAVTVGLLKDLSARLARLDYALPPQDLTISLRRIPARPRSGVVISGVRAPAQSRSTTMGA